MTVADRKSRRPRDGVVTRRSHLGDNRAAVGVKWLWVDALPD
jgi:hypothetical protein